MCTLVLVKQASICTFVLVIPDSAVAAATASSLNASGVSICSFVLVKQVNWVCTSLNVISCVREGASVFALLYCSKASKLDVPRSTRLVSRHAPSCQYLYLCTSKASKLDVPRSTRLVSRRAPSLTRRVGQAHLSLSARHYTRGRGLVRREAEV